MAHWPFVLVSPGTRGLSLALVRHYLRNTPYPVFTTYRSGTADAVADEITAPLGKAEKDRLKVFKLDLTDEHTIAEAAKALAKSVPADKNAYLHTAFITGGVLHPERQPADLNLAKVEETFRINAISHLLMIKYFSRFLPPARASVPEGHISKWVHVSARVGSVSDNKLGGWFSYRSSKAAVNQIVRTFDLDLQYRHMQAMCIGVHPGTVKTDLSKEFWGGMKKDRLFEPEYAAEKLFDVVEGAGKEKRGRIWDWKGEEVIP